jgi:phage gp29-like protein
VIPGEGKWVLFTPYGKKRPWSFGAWRPISRWWLMKSYAMEDAARHSELHGQGLLIGTVAKGTKEPERKKMSRQLNQRGREASMVVEEGNSVALIEASANTWEMFQGIWDSANKAISVIFLGQNLSTDVSGGSLAATDTHEGIELRVLRGYGLAIAECLHFCAIRPWARVNHGSEAAAPLPCWDPSPPEDVKLKADTLLAQAQAIATCATLPPEVDRRALLERGGIPLLDPDKVPAAAPANPTSTPSAETAVQPALLTSPPPPPSQALASRVITLASGDRLPQTSGVVQGQAYVDQLADDHAGHGTAALAPDIDAVLAVINSASDPTQLAEDLRSLHADLDPGPLAETVRKALLLGALRGRWAVQEDL